MLQCIMWSPTEKRKKYLLMHNQLNNKALTSSFEATSIDYCLREQDVKLYIK